MRLFCSDVMLGYESIDGVLWDSWFYAAFGRSFVCCSELCSDWLHACCPLGLSFSLEFSAVLGCSLQVIHRHSLPSRLRNLTWVGHTCTCYRVLPFFVNIRAHSLPPFCCLLIPTGNFYLIWWVEWRVSQIALAFTHQKFSQMAGLCSWIISLLS